MAVAGIRRPQTEPESPVVIPPTPEAPRRATGAKSTFSSPGNKRRQLPPTPPGVRAPPPIFIPPPQSLLPSPLPPFPAELRNGFVANPLRAMHRQDKVNDAVAQSAFSHQQRLLAANAAAGIHPMPDERQLPIPVGYDQLEDEDFFDDEFGHSEPAAALDFEDYFWSHRPRQDSEYESFANCNSFKMEKIAGRGHAKRQSKSHRHRNSSRVPRRIVYSYAPV